MNKEIKNGDWVKLNFNNSIPISRKLNYTAWQSWKSAYNGRLGKVVNISGVDYDHGKYFIEIEPNFTISCHFEELEIFEDKKIMDLLYG